MEKKIKIYYSEYGALSRVEEHESAPVGVNLAALEKFYDEMGERHKKQFDKFAAYWEEEGFEKLFNPAARVVTMPVAVAEENFGCGSSREHAVWGLMQAMCCRLMWARRRLNFSITRLETILRVLITALMYSIAIWSCVIAKARKPPLSPKSPRVRVMLGKAFW